MTAPVTPDRPDDARDAWLQQALRHAPDADLRPPAELSEAILREAQARLRGNARGASGTHGVAARLWTWLGHPAGAAGLAGVMVAVLVGTMWWQRPLPPPFEDVPVAAAPAPAPSPRPAPAPQATAPKDEAAAAAPRAQAPRIARERSASPAPTKAAAPRSASPGARIESAAPQAPAAPPPSSAEVAAQADAMAGVSRRAAPQRQPGAAPLADAVAGPPLTALRTRLAAEPARWTLRRDDEAPRAVDPALEHAMAALDGLARNRAWARSAPGAAPVAADALRLELLQDGDPVARLALTDDGAHWHTPGGASWRLALTPVEAQALRQAFADALPR